jgi:hypothetical protein
MGPNSANNMDKFDREFLNSPDIIDKKANKAKGGYTA